jgi:hypothetical protein
MNLKKKLEAVKTKVKAHAPEIIAITSVVIAGTVTVVLARKTTVKDSNGNAVQIDDWYFNHIKEEYAKLMEQRSAKSTDAASQENVRYDTMTTEKLKEQMNDGRVTVYSVEDDDVTFYKISD